MTPDTLDTLNTKLAAADLMVMQQSNLRYAIYRIERGAMAMHDTRYDTYKRALSASFETLEEVAIMAACLTEVRHG